MFDKDKAREEVKKRMPWLFKDDAKKRHVKNKIITPRVIEKKRDSRIDEMSRLRFEEKKTYSEIGLVFGVSRERVRQLFVAHNIDATITLKRKNLVKCVCGNVNCGKEFEVYKLIQRKHCSRECRLSDNIIGKPRAEWTKEDWSIYNKNRNCRPGAIASRKKYLERNREKIYKKNREYIKEYSKRPEVIARNKEYVNRPEVKERIKERRKQREIEKFKNKSKK